MSAETLHTCPSCGTQGFTERGLKAHKCKGENRNAGAKDKKAKARAATMPRTKLKRRPAKVVKEAPLLIKLGDLKFHPLLTRVSMLPDLIERETKLGNAQGKSRGAHKAAAEEMRHDFEALVESISKHGVRDRIKVIKSAKGWQIVDGRHRFEAASKVAKMAFGDEKRETIAHRIAIDGIPCEEVTEADVVPIIMDAVTRRHMSKGARAYLAVLMEPEVAAATQGKRTDLSTSAFSAEVLAKRAGVSPRLVEDAIHLFRLFEKRKDVRKKFEDAIWVGAGLAKLRAGIEGYLATGKEPEEEPETEEEARKRIAMERVESAMKPWTSVTTTLKHWDTMPKSGRDEVVRVACEAIQAAPEEFRIALAAEWLGKPKH